MTPRQELEEMIDRFSPEIAKLARGVLARVRKRLTGAQELVYDNPYALVVGFGATDRASEAVISVVINPRKVVLCFLWGVNLDDPDGLLEGGGRQVRHTRIDAPKDLDRPALKRLIKAAAAASETPFKKQSRPTTQIRAISKKKRPRRPVA